MAGKQSTVNSISKLIIAEQSLMQEEKARHKEVRNLKVLDTQGLLIRLVIAWSMKLIFQQSFEEVKKGIQEDYLVERTSLDKNNSLCRGSESAWLDEK